MGTETKSKRRCAWHSACLICKAALDFVYTIGVGLLALSICVFAYVATIDETDMPDVLVQLLERELKAQGITLSMSGIRLKPNGRITIDKPSLYSTDLQSEIARADRIQFKVDPALFLFSQTRLSELDVQNGSLIVPALLSPSGVPEPIIDQIDLHALNELRGWSIERSKFRFGGARASLIGIVDLEGILPPEQTEPVKPLSQQLVEFHKKAWDAKEALSHVEGLEGRFLIDAPRKSQRNLEAVLTAVEGRWKDQVLVRDIRIGIQSTLGQFLRLDAQVGSLAGQGNRFAREIELEADWDTFPSAEAWQPSKAALSMDSGGQSIKYASNLFLNASALEDGAWGAEAFVNIVDSAWELSTIVDPVAKTATVNLSGSPTPGMIALAKDIALEVRPELADQPIDSLIEVIDPPEINLVATFDGALRPKSVEASLVVDRITSLDAPFDRVIAEANLEGNQLSVPNLWLRSGKQGGWLSVDLDLETLKRRMLIDGTFNPSTVNGWIPEEWWTELWSNFEFPEEGFYCLMDSSQIIKRPETLWLTGYALGEDLGIRGHPMKDIELRMFILQRYFDLYDLNLNREEGYVRGDFQFSIDRDPRDDQFKMSALWLDAESTIDVSIGPDVIYEVRENVEEILEPYGYQIPPRVRAKSSSVRHKGDFTYSVDLQVDSDHAFSYFHYPLDSVSADVLVANDRASIRSVTADLASGVLTADAEVRGEDIDLNVSLDDAHFGNTLGASATYFAANDEESSANEFSPEELSSYGGIASLTFQGKGIVGDSQSFDGKGTYQISGADFYQLQLFGGLSRLFDNAGLPIATLKFEDAEGAFDVNKRYVEFPELRLKGPVAQIKSGGNYDLEEGDLDFKAQLQPFRSVPLIQIATLPLDLVSGIFEVSLTGTISDPDWSLFRGARKRETEPESTAENDSD